MGDVTRDLQALYDQLAAAGSPPAIYGHLRVAQGGRERDFLLGSRTVMGAVRVLDWRTAPLAEVFFRHRAGDEYELDVDGREVTGRVLARHRVRVAGGRVELGAAAALPPPAATSQGRVEIVLDALQRRAVELPDDTSLVVDGEAGVGKTVVAMHRLAHLRARADHAHRRWRALVLVPTEGLRRLCRQMAERVGVETIEIALIDEWLLARARAAFARLPARTSTDAAAGVIRLKRHPAVRAVLGELLRRPPARDDDERRLPRARADLLHLWGDRPRLDRVIAAAGGALDPRDVAAVIAHTRVQFTATTEEAHRHVDADRLVAIDGRTLDDGTPTGDAGTIDAEDVPVLFELARLRGARLTGLPAYDHIVLDEAQLLAPMELAAVADALRPGGTVTVAGDHRQETDDSAWFGGWAAAMGELRAARWEQVTLETTYRSVPAIAAFARALAAAPPARVEPSPALAATAAASELELVADVGEVVERLQDRDGALQIAVIGRNPEHAQRLHRDLGRAVDATLVLDGAFTFAPGVVVTTAAQVQGLEFDAVIVPDLTPELYRATPTVQRSLYVTVTRARTWLWLLTAQAWSPLVTVDATPARS